MIYANASRGASVHTSVLRVSVETVAGVGVRVELKGDGAAAQTEEKYKRTFGPGRIVDLNTFKRQTTADGSEAAVGETDRDGTAAVGYV